MCTYTVTKVSWMQPTQGTNHALKRYREKEKINDPELYALMMRGNDIADALAKLATDKKPLITESLRNQSASGPKRRLRDWSTEPTFNTDNIYITQETHSHEGFTHRWVDFRIHSWIKEDTQKQILAKELKNAKKKKKPGKHCQYLLLLPLCNQK
jgi:hypothetical protein